MERRRKEQLGEETGPRHCLGRKVFFERNSSL